MKTFDEIIKEALPNTITDEMLSRDYSTTFKLSTIKDLMRIASEQAINECANQCEDVFTCNEDEIEVYEQLATKDSILDVKNKLK